MKCDICNQEIRSKKLYQGDFWQINGAVIGSYIKITGHRQCCEAVDALVVIPNRIRDMAEQEMIVGAKAPALILTKKRNLPIPEVDDDNQKAERRDKIK